MAEDAGALIVRSGLITEEQLVNARQAQAMRGGTVGEYLILEGFTDDEELAEFYRTRLMVPRVTLRQLARIAKGIVAKIPAEMATEFRCVPVSLDRDGNLTVAMADPSTTHAADEIAFFTGYYVARAVATQSQIAWALAHYYGKLTPLGEHLLDDREAVIPGPMPPLAALAPTDKSGVHRIPRMPTDTGPTTPERLPTNEDITGRVEAERHHAMPPVMSPFHEARTGGRTFTPPTPEERRAVSSPVPVLIEDPEEGPPHLHVRKPMPKPNPNYRPQRFVSFLDDDADDGAANGSMDEYPPGQPEEARANDPELTPRSGEVVVASGPITLPDQPLPPVLISLPGEASGEIPGEASGEIPGEASGEIPGEAPGEASGEIPGEASGEVPGEVAAQYSEPIPEILSDLPDRTVPNQAPQGFSDFAAYEPTLPHVPARAEDPATPASDDTPRRMRESAATEPDLAGDDAFLGLFDDDGTVPDMKPIPDGASEPPEEPARPLASARALHEAAARQKGARGKKRLRRTMIGLGFVTQREQIPSASPRADTEPAELDDTAEFEPRATDQAAQDDAAPQEIPDIPTLPAASPWPTISALDSLEKAAEAAAEAHAKARGKRSSAIRPDERADRPGSTTGKSTARIERPLASVTDETDDEEDEWGPPGTTIPPPFLGAISGEHDMDDPRSTEIAEAIAPASLSQDPLVDPRLPLPEPAAVESEGDGSVPEPIDSRLERSGETLQAPLSLYDSEDVTPTVLREFENSQGDLAEVLRFLQLAETRDAVIEVLVHHLHHSHAHVAFFAVRAGRLEPFKVRGSSIYSGDDPNEFARLWLRLDFSSTFHDIVATRLPFRGPITDQASQDFIHKTFGSLNSPMLGLPVTVRERVVGVLYGDTNKRRVFVENLGVMARAAGGALERIIKYQKG